jgi:hypothetical protein
LAARGIVEPELGAEGDTGGEICTADDGGATPLGAGSGAGAGAIWAGDCCGWILVCAGAGADWGSVSTTAGV